MVQPEDRIKGRQRYLTHLTLTARQVVNGIMKVFHTSPVLSILDLSFFVPGSIYVVAHRTIIWVGKENIRHTLREVAFRDQGRTWAFVECRQPSKDCLARILSWPTDCLGVALKEVSVGREQATRQGYGLIGT